MAFVYCNDRWKNNKENNFPGPCQYGGDQESSCELTQNAASRLLKSMKKSKQQRKMTQKSHQKAFKEVVNQKIIDVDVDNKNNRVKSHARKGKLYRNHSVEMKKSQQKFIQEQTQLKIMIKNAFHNQTNVGSRNKWGNMRIKEMLNEHRENQLKKNSMRIYNKQNKTVLIQENRQKLKQQLMQLQTIFTTQRKGVNHLQHTNKRKTPANKFLAHTLSQNQLRYSEPSKEDLQVQPSAVYISEKYSCDPYIYFKHDNSIAPVTPMCSIGGSKLAIKEKSIPTGLQDDSFDEDSMEYISDATPGPGSYNIQMETSKISTRMEKFGVTMQRFKPQKIPLTHALTVPIIPQYKVSTNARQQDVGFGRSTKEEKVKPQIAHNGVFYEDHTSLEYKSFKTLCKRRKDNLCFDSSKGRFPQKDQKKLPIQSEDDSESDESQQIQEIQEKPTTVFLSKVNRQLEYKATPTQNVDFSGQNYNCIANKLKRQKQYIEDYDLNPVPFLVNAKRFKYKQVKAQEKKDQLLGIKIQQLKKKKEIKKKIEEKGFTFSKGAKQDLNEKNADEIPSPVYYEKSTGWIKPSYNIRFN